MTGLACFLPMVAHYAAHDSVLRAESGLPLALLRRHEDIRGPETVARTAILMPTRVAPTLLDSNVLCVIMGGGQGTRLFRSPADARSPPCPLPQVPAGGHSHLELAINSTLRRIYVLTQFNSASLHRHISQSYKFDHFGGGFVEILAAEADLLEHLLVSRHCGRGTARIWFIC